MNKVQYLVKFNTSWADEFDVSGFKIFKDGQEAQNVIDQAVKNGFIFGTNEGFAAGHLHPSDFKLEVINDGQVFIIESLFPDCTDQGYGIFPIFD